MEIRVEYQSKKIMGIDGNFVIIHGCLEGSDCFKNLLSSVF